MAGKALHFKLKLSDGRVLHYLDGSMSIIDIVDRDSLSASHVCTPTFGYVDEDSDEVGIGPLRLRSIEFPLPGVNNLKRTTLTFLNVHPGITEEEVRKLLTPKYGWSESDENLVVHWGTEDQ